ncbi:MAG: hypothetical protein LC650_01270 [Actinobacteria bacterium]|nr:hypothetical protein [Actinomycetota bacterium]
MSEKLKEFQKNAKVYVRDTCDMIKLAEEAESASEMYLIISSVHDVMTKQLKRLRTARGMEDMLIIAIGESPYTGVNDEQRQKSIGNMIERAMKLTVEALTRGEDGERQEDFVTEDDILKMFKRASSGGGDNDWTRSHH